MVLRVDGPESGFGVALVWLWYGFGVAFGWLSDGFGWLWVAFVTRLPHALRRVSAPGKERLKPRNTRNTRTGGHFA